MKVGLIYNVFVESPGFELLAQESQREVLKRRIKEMVARAKENDTIIFLDKSARPLSTAFLAEWQQEFPDQKPPRVRFLNIGTEKIPVIVRWAEAHMAKPESGAYTIESVVSDESLTAVFGQENVDTIKTVLSQSEQALIVDDLSHSGRSMRIAEAVIHAVKPEIKIEQFFTLSTDEEKAPFIADKLPFLPWRGITGVEDPTQEEPDQYSQFGRENKKGFLVQPLPPEKTELRQKSRQLRRELRQLMVGR